LLSALRNLPQLPPKTSTGNYPPASGLYVRHDRVNDLTNECPVYKGAYTRMYRQQRRPDLLYYVVTNEFDPARLDKMMSDSCVDGVIHVHKACVVDVCGMNGRMEKLIDLADFVKVSAFD
jgi:hypothetical protein